MFGGIMRYIECETCGESALRFDVQTTFEDYSHPDVFVLENVDKIVDGIIGEYLVYVCTKCGARGKYTFKEMEKLLRKEISKKVLTILAQKEMIKTDFSKVKVLIYCGKCRGIDGKGSCLKSTYEKCKLKRLPNVL